MIILSIKRGTFDGIRSQARQKRLKWQKSDMADSIFGQKSGPALAGPAGPATTALIGQRITVLWPQRNLNRDFALAGEKIHEHKFSFYITFLT